MLLHCFFLSPHQSYTTFRLFKAFLLWDIPASFQYLWVTDSIASLSLLTWMNS